MKANLKIKIQFMILVKTPRQSIILNINQIKVRESQKVVLLGLTIDNRLTSNDYVDMFCSTANYKLHELRSIRKYLTLKKAKLLYNASVNSKFKYVLVIWCSVVKKMLPKN